MIQAGTNARPDVFFGSVYRPTAGFNYGIELPDEITAISLRNLDLASTTVESRIANSVEWWTYVNEWNLVASVSTLPYFDGFAARDHRIHAVHEHGSGVRRSGDRCHERVT